jgi:Ca2+-binding RTX toxin-like protein
MKGICALILVVYAAVAASGNAGGATCTIDGTPGKDRLIGTPGNDVICGRAGIDRIAGRGGDDVRFGGHEHDVIRAGRGSDRV